MLVSSIKEENLTFDVIDRLLFCGIEDTGENADCIIVLGSSKASKYRIPVAAKAYHEGRSSKIMLCGGVVRDFQGEKCSESEHMRRSALVLGVPEENIILENSSQNTIENILFAMAELQRAFWLNKVRRVLLITTAYHTRRSLAVARAFFPKYITVIPCPANDNNTRRDNWMNTPDGIQRAKVEAMKIVRYVQNGVISDYGKDYEIVMIPIDEETAPVELKTVSAVTEPQMQGWYNGRNESDLHEAITVSRKVSKVKDFKLTTLFFPVKAGEPLPLVTKNESRTLNVYFEGKEYTLDINELNK